MSTNRDYASPRPDPPTPLDHTLRAAQEQLQTAQHQISLLEESNTRLRQELTALTRRGAQAQHDAYHDQLTCLPNRRLLVDRLNQALAQAVRQHKTVVLLLLDLDGFKAVNDAFGHEIGDKVLQEVAERLLACIRNADTACRYGGDEFVVMLPEIGGEDHCASVEQKICSRLAAPYYMEGIEMTVNVSIGTAIFPTHARTASDLLKYADMLMYRAKTNGG